MKFSSIALVIASVAAAPETFTFTKKNARGVISEGTIVKDKAAGKKISEMRHKFKDYFNYSFKAKGLPEKATDDTMEVPECSTSQECEDSGKMQKCCVNTVLYHRASKTKDVNYRCMTRAVVDANINLKISDFEV